MHLVKLFFLYSVLSLLTSMNLFGQTIPNRNSEWMLLNSSGKYFYLDGFNMTNVWTDSVIVYNSRGAGNLRKSLPVILVENGISKGIAKYSGTLNKNTIAIAGMWDSMKWLKANIKAGRRVQIIPAKAFLPFSISFPIDQVDKGIVKSGKLAVFTPAFGSKTPSTIYRQQAIISKGRVVGKTGGNADIPADGFVLSGHGTGYFPAGASRILRWVGIGCKVQLSSDKKSFTVITDRETWFLRAEDSLKKAKQFASENSSRLEFAAKSKSIEYINAASQMLKSAQISKGNNNDEVAWFFIKQSMNFSEKAMISACLPVSPNSMRSIAVSSPRDFREIELIREAGFDTIMLHYHKSTVPKLAALLETARFAKEAGLKVFLWTWLPSGFPMLESVKKELSIDLKKDGKPTGFVDLSVPENRHAVCKELVRVCELFNADGVMFDYEKYRGGYGKESIKRFCKKENIATKTFSAAKISGEMEKKWEIWLRKNVKTMLFEACKTLHGMSRPRKTILCVFSGGAENAKSLREGATAHPGPTVWLDWLKTSNFDIVLFMLYVQDINWLKQRTELLFPLLRKHNEKLKIESWLIYWPETCGWTNPVPLDNLLQQSDTVIRAGTDGVSYFSSSNIKALTMPYFQVFFNATRNGVYRLASPVQTNIRISPVNKAKISKKQSKPQTVNQNSSGQIWQSKYIRKNNSVWKYSQFGTAEKDPSVIRLDELIPMKYRGKYWRSTKFGRHGHPLIFPSELDYPTLTYVAQKKTNGNGYWSTIGFCAPEEGIYSVSGEIKFQRYKNGAPVNRNNIEVLLFSSSGTRKKKFYLRSGNSSKISNDILIEGIEMNKNDMLTFRPLTGRINANVAFQALFKISVILKNSKIQ